MANTPATNATPRGGFSRYAPWVGITLLLAAVATVSFIRADAGRFDFQHFYLDARYVWQHGELNPDLENPDKLLRRQLPFYLPTVPLMLSLAASGGPKIAAIVWAAGQTLSLAVALWLLSRWRRTAASSRSGGLLPVACILSAYAIYEAAKFNQLTLPILALLVGAFTGLERGRPMRAGALFGLAAVVKLLPGLFVVWLVLKRQWKALGAMLVTAAAVTSLPPLVVFGPSRTVQYHRQWLEHNLEGAPAQSMATDDASNEHLDDHFIDRRNQALPLVLTRLFSPDHPKRVSYQPVTLSTSTCVWLARGILGVLLLGLIWRTRRPWRLLTHSERQVEFAVYLLGMIVFSPLVRQYYLAWALPALLLFVRLVRSDREQLRSASRQLHRVGWAGIAVWLLGMLVWAWEPARVCGAHWLMLILVSAFLMAARTGPRKGGAVSTV